LQFRSTGTALRYPSGRYGGTTRVRREWNPVEFDRPCVDHERFRFFRVELVSRLTQLVAEVVAECERDGSGARVDDPAGIQVV
jgi:hypothetical protein